MLSGLSASRLNDDRALPGTIAVAAIAKRVFLRCVAPAQSDLFPWTQDDGRYRVIAFFGFDVRHRRPPRTVQFSRAANLAESDCRANPNCGGCYRDIKAAARFDQ